MSRRGWIGSLLLIVTLIAVTFGLVTWKQISLRGAQAAAAAEPEPMESVTVAIAKQTEHTQKTTTIGTVMSLRSITLRNELAGTVKEVMLTPGQIVEEGTVLVALDVAVEQAELAAQEAQATLAETLLGRMKRANENRGAPEVEVDRARAEHQIALANIARTKAIIARKTLRAPFRARVGMSDVHQGQYLIEGTELTTLQGVDDAANVDFSVPQQVAEGLEQGSCVEVFAGRKPVPIEAKIVAVDARVDASTRSAMVRARIEGVDIPAPGSSVRVRVPIGTAQQGITIPVSALRKGPEGDHVFVIINDDTGKTRVQVRSVVSGTVLGDEVVIRSGLLVGERVAASGSFKLREGVLVMIANDAEKGGSP